MPNPHEQNPANPAIPTPATITPALLKTHSITPDEYARIEKALGRTPSLTELGIFSVMWSEHCSYKSSRVHLKRLPTKGTRTSGPGSVLQGPGENAGIIDVGDGWACAFKIESHNHPSYIEPYQGAATGVGGILRDIFTMGARPLAVMDSLRFGPLTPGDRAQGSGLSKTEPEPLALSPETCSRNRHTMAGVVHGVGGYGNCFGVPNLGGETRFEDCYSGNPLVNAFALGLVRTDEIFYAKAEGVGNPVFYVGAKTGRDGIHGATMASEEFTEGSEQKRPNVQMGDPFLEKLLLEACLEVMKTGAVLGIQDMGAAGLTCSTCEMGARGELGVTIELDKVPQRETGMSSYEIMLSESQERMLLVAEKGREEEVLAVFRKWGLDCAEVGIVTADDVMRVFHGGVLQAEIPNKSLTDDAPVYHRPVGTWTAPVPKDPPAWVLEELKKPRDYTADLKKLLASPNICSKHYIYEQYDSMVQTNTVQGPGGEAGVMRIKGTGQGSSDRTQAPVKHGLLETITDFIAESTPEGEAAMAATTPGAPRLASETWDEPPPKPEHEPATHPGAPSLASETWDKPAPKPEHEPATHPGAPRLASETWDGPPPKPERGLAMALAGNGRWCYLDPKLGAMHAVAEAARKVACTGATPVAATNCLNFGNPEKPEIMAQLSAAIDGIAEACTALGTPVTGGNVSLYNETKGEGIYPTPVIGIVGILDDVRKTVPSSFQCEGEVVAVLQPNEPSPFGLVESDDDAARIFAAWSKASYERFGSSDYAKTILGTLWGSPPPLLLTGAAKLQQGLAALVSEGVITSAKDISDGGLAAALAQMTFAKGIGATVAAGGPNMALSLFEEHASEVIVTFKASVQEKVRRIAEFNGLWLNIKGETEGQHLLIGSIEGVAVEAEVADLRTAYSAALEAQLAEEALA